MVRLKLDTRLLAQTLPESVRHTHEGHDVVLHLPPGESVQHTLEKHGVQLTQPVIAVINQRTADFTRVLKDGDDVRLLPQIAGG